MKNREFTFASTTGQKLDARMWLPEGEPRAAVQIVHGMAEHIDRYEEVAGFLAEQGMLVVGHTHLGHGPLGRPRGYFGAENGWQNLEEDVHRLREMTQAEFPNAPYFLLGHSMGSFIARCYLRDHGKGLAGCVLSGTGFFTRAQAKMGLFVANLVCRLGGARKPSHLINRLAFGGMNRPFQPVRTEFDWLSRDSYVVDRYLVDPYCGFTFTGAGYRDLFTGLKRLSDTAELEQIPKTLPVLFLSGDHDPVGDMALGVERVADELCTVGLNDVTILLYPDARHEILNEINRYEVYDDLLEWLDTRLAGEKGRPVGYRPEQGSLAGKRKAAKKKRAKGDAAEEDAAPARPAIEKPAEETPAAEASAPARPAIEKPAEEDAAAEASAPARPAIEKPAEENAAAEASAPARPAIEKPAEEPPAAEASAPSKPAIEKPAEENAAEADAAPARPAEEPPAAEHFTAARPAVVRHTEIKPAVVKSAEEDSTGPFAS